MKRWLVVLLMVSALGGVFPGTMQAEGGSHVVQPGDTLYSLALRYATTVEALRAANALPSDLIYAGQTLIIPRAAPVPATGGSHVVQPGETLYGLALRYGTTVEALRALNALPSDMIFAGQIVRVAGSPPHAPAPAAPTASGAIYFVQPGDTLTWIASVHGVSVGALAQLNGLRVDSWVYTGQRLLLPRGPNAPAPPPAYAPAPSQPGGHFHIVRPRETLGDIAAHYGTTALALARANGIVDPARIVVGQRLLIPGYQVAAAPPAPTPKATTPPRAAAPTATPKPAPPTPAPTATAAASSAPPYVPPSVPSSEPPVIVKVWRATVDSSSCTPRHTGEFRSILHIFVEGRTGQGIDLYAQPVQQSTYLTWSATGSKPELGAYGAEIAPLGAGKYTVVVPGIGEADVALDGQCTATVRFAQVTR